ncbi:MAG: glutaredoxin family protein [Desulfobacterales bacterium]
MNNPTPKHHPNVTLYSLMTCSHCKDAKKYLRDQGVDFRLIQIDLLVGEERNAAMRALRQLNPECSFPTIQVGDTAIVGFKPDLLHQVLGF